MQIAVGLRRLGHDVYYFETTSDWPYDPVRRRRSASRTTRSRTSRASPRASGSATGGRTGAATSTRSGSGCRAGRAEGLLASADLVLNVAGSTTGRGGASRDGPPRVLRDRSRVPRDRVRQRRRGHGGDHGRARRRRDVRREHRHAALARSRRCPISGRARASRSCWTSGQTGRRPRDVHHRRQLAAGRTRSRVRRRDATSGASTTSS